MEWYSLNCLKEWGDIHVDDGFLEVEGFNETWICLWLDDLGSNDLFHIGLIISLWTIIANLAP